MKTDADRRVVWALRRAQQAVEAAKEERLRPVGLPAAHYSLLITIASQQGLTGADAARRLGVSPQNVAQLVTRLERRGLVRRAAHARHRHVIELHLTDEGRDVLTAADDAVADLEAAVVAHLGTDDAEHLRRLLDAVREGLGRHDAP